MNTYTIEYEELDEAYVPRFGHESFGAESAAEAIEEFRRIRPDADIVELRRVHVR